MKKIKRIVIKLGTSVITDSDGKIKKEHVSGIVDQVAEGIKSGVEVALVSSGAIAVGMERLKIATRPKEIAKLQAIASVGQGLLIRMYSDLFSSHGIPVGQILLTRQDVTDRRQYLNARRTLDTLFEMGAVPVVNENDTVATEEITLGDNDILAGLVTALTHADMLALLTDTEGLFTGDPRKDENAKLLQEVSSITPQIEKLGGGTGSRFASGGMSSKIQAAKIAVLAGSDAIICDGQSRSVILDILKGKEVGTRFLASKAIKSKKHWIGFAKQSSGRLVIDEGAAKALIEKGKSLLSAGVVEIEGEFSAGDCVDIFCKDGRYIGRGLVNYGYREAERVKGLRSDQIEEVLGDSSEVLVHRDQLLVLETPGGTNE